MKKITKIAGLLAGLALAGSLFTSCFTDSEYDDSLVARTTVTFFAEDAEDADAALAGSVDDKIEGNTLLSISTPAVLSSETEAIATACASIELTAPKSAPKVWAFSDSTGISVNATEEDSKNIVYTTFALKAEKDCKIISYEAFASNNSASGVEIVGTYKVGTDSEDTLPGTSAANGTNAHNQVFNSPDATSLELKAGDVVTVTLKFNLNSSTSNKSIKKAGFVNVTVVAEEN
ncbi:hypothetical protein [Treponema sp.]|uniref:hypothetical protein n=1 Tax=Treponema sp. TaxID=166 RepID=UPI00388E5BF8